MNARGWSCLGLVALALACGRRAETTTAGDARSTPAPSASGSAVVFVVGGSAPAASAVRPPEAPPPPTDYRSLAEAEADGDKAIGKTVLIRTTRGALLADTVKLTPCVWDVHDSGHGVRASYVPAKRALVRAIPSLVGPECTRVIIRLDGKRTGSTFERTTFVDAIDVHPSSAVASSAAPDADYGSTDDLLLAADSAVGKVARIPIRKTSGTSANEFDAQACDVTGVAVHLEYQPAQQAVVDALPSGFSPCRTVRVKMQRLTDRREGTWRGVLVDVLSEQ